MFRLVGALSTLLYISEGPIRKQVYLRQCRTMMTHLILYTFSLLFNPSFLGPYLLLSRINLMWLNPTSFVHLHRAKYTKKSVHQSLEWFSSTFALLSLKCIYVV